LNLPIGWSPTLGLYPGLGHSIDFHIKVLIKVYIIAIIASDPAMINNTNSTKLTP